MTRLRALIVDDDFAVARVHRGIVESHPAYAVVGEAYTGRDALEAITRLSPDVVLLDVYLPDISGLDVLTRIRQNTSKSIEVIAVTAARDLNSVRTASANGVHHYLVKPFTSSALRERLDSIVDSRKAIQRNASGGPLDQRAVDQILTTGSAARRTPPPKGYSAATLERVEAMLAAQENDVSASELAANIGMSRVGARRYLEHLVTSGQAVVEPRYGSTGRPEHRYRAVSNASLHEADRFGKPDGGRDNR